ncbi:unnamed protein product (macronuclear) [Paramecium tetraurelia]|uniref:Uncharacterized protein n=1 Tax=Paramecium tetraurelia TaxID=5888 RepID=A0C6U4_PARTE|nr:uncharacterized protein GSPATT00035640001 [Paramecium tetraurelia]CAK66511.1 unnamed protein product [Paramecium tetraurelia]|eukprot:XP_001433908.1 hypothetical protein (macronuclear) [Paramecium tetraurelia strain d4-2]
MNQLANYMQCQTKRVVSVYQQQCYCRSPQGRKCAVVNQQFSPNEQKYMKQFKCIDQQKYQQPKAIIYLQKGMSPTNKQPLIATKLKVQDKENNNNNHYYNANIIFQPCKTPRDTLKQQLFSQQNSPNIKQPTPQFENRYNQDYKNQESRLSKSQIKFRFVDSEKQTSDEQQLKIIANQLNKIQIGPKVPDMSPNSIKSDEFLVQMDSVKKSDYSNKSQTKNVCIQAFESTQFEKHDEQLSKIFGSLKKLKIIKKKQTQPTLQTQVTQRTMEEDSMMKLDSQQDQYSKPISGLSEIEIQYEKFQTELTNLVLYFYDKGFKQNQKPLS